MSPQEEDLFSRQDTLALLNESLPLTDKLRFYTKLFASISLL